MEQNKDRACLDCGTISGSNISACPNCKGGKFRPLTEAEKKDTTPRIIYRRTHPTDYVEQVKTNIFFT